MTTDKTIHADVVVVGFGRGGKIAALQLGKAGKTVVIVEQSDQMYGGTCPNVGCVPTKALVHAANNRRPSDVPDEFYERAVGEVHEITSLFRKGNYEGMNGLESATVLTGHAEFIDERTVRVDAAEG